VQVHPTSPVPPRTAVDTADGPSFIPVEGVGLVEQAHGGALRTSTPEARSKGGMMHRGAA